MPAAMRCPAVPGHRAGKPDCGFRRVLAIARASEGGTWPGGQARPSNCAIALLPDQRCGPRAMRIGPCRRRGITVFEYTCSISPPIICLVLLRDPACARGPDVSGNIRLDDEEKKHADDRENGVMFLTVILILNVCDNSFCCKYLMPAQAADQTKECCLQFT
jgi:hypothetical protein